MDEREIAKYREQEKKDADLYAYKYRMDRVALLSGPEYRAERRKIVDEESKRRLTAAGVAYREAMLRIMVAVVLLVLFAAVVVVYAIVLAT